MDKMEFGYIDLDYRYIHYLTENIWNGFLLSLIVTVILMLILNKRFKILYQNFIVSLLLSLSIVLLYAVKFDISNGFVYNPSHMYNLMPFIWVAQPYNMGLKKMITLFIINILIYIPIGFFIRLIFESTIKRIYILGILLCTACLIEIIQPFFGRSGDIDDVIMNMIGGGIGVLIFLCLKNIIRYINRTYEKSYKTKLESLE